jgi:Fur family transcriptional regulator, ferric uptake regulator
MSQINNQTPNTGEILKVLYDGECPMCRKEIADKLGFTLVDHSLSMYGSCKACKKK